MAQIDTLATRREAHGKVPYWDAELKSAETVLKSWVEDSNEIMKIYSMYHDEYGGDFLYSRSSRFNILWSNIETMKPAVYEKMPIPVIKRRYEDPDNIGRLAAVTLQRAVMTDMETNEREGYSLNDALDKICLEFLLIARGTGWMRYEADIRGEGDFAQVTREATILDFVSYKDFLHCPKKTWADVIRSGWVARAVDMTRMEGFQKFGDIFRHVPLNMDNRHSMSSDVSIGQMFQDTNEEVLQKARVWEIWDAKTRSVVWINREFQASPLKEIPDPLGLEGFFPCPRPAYGTMMSNTLMPTPDYNQYKKHVHALEKQTTKIDKLTEALKVVGFYDASAAGLGEMLSSNSMENKLIPVELIAGANAGLGQGQNGFVQYLPINMVAETLLALYDARQRTKEVIYEISGISDILRGNVDPREKLGQSRIKEQNAGSRIGTKRKVMERFACDIIRRKCELICEHYEPKTIFQLSGFDQIPEVNRAMRQGFDPSQLFMNVLQLLKSDKTRGFHIEIETKSTIEEDDDMEKQRRNEYIEAMGNFIERSAPIAMNAPHLIPLIGEMMRFSSKTYRAGREIEDVIDQTIDGMIQQSQQPDPIAQQEEQAAERDAQMQAQQQEMQMAMEQQKTQSQLQLTQAQAQIKMMELAMKRQELETKMAANQEDAALKQQAAMMDAELKQLEIENERAKINMEAEAEQRKVMLSIAQNEMQTQNAIRQQTTAAQLNNASA